MGISEASSFIAGSGWVLLRGEIHDGKPGAAGLVRGRDSVERGNRPKPDISAAPSIAEWDRLPYRQICDAPHLPEWLEVYALTLARSCA